MRKILCQLQDCERIRTISFDDKTNTITIVGPFDPQRLVCKLRCKGGKIIKEIHIVDISGGGGKPPPPPPPQNIAEPPPPSSPPPVKPGKKPKKPPTPVAADEPPPAAPAPAPEHEMPLQQPPSPAHQAPGMSAMVPAFIEKHPQGNPAELEPAPPISPPRNEKTPLPMDMPAPPVALPPPTPVKERFPPPMRSPCDEQPRIAEYVIPTVEIPSWPGQPVGPCGCPCCAPCYQGYYEGCRCICCGSRLYGQPLIPAAAAAGCGYRGCRTISDEDPTAACSIM
ncbi:hypothetical protein HU200_048984 [Digitaria exilis]|uniref:Uncharacterized protein n=1 Tax=Digitaria exilis TaxID=1010633 RepID=A0A835EBT8_9POAL|nr:hypothetical protein HU200_048984 [Digitaria exilis]